MGPDDDGPEFDKSPYLTSVWPYLIVFVMIIATVFWLAVSIRGNK